MNIGKMQNRDMTLKQIFIITNFVVEIPSAVFDQLSSLKPQYALISMIMSFAILLISIIDLAHMGGKESVKLMRRGLIPWFYSPYPNYKPLGSFVDIVGLVCGIFQCVFTTISYASLTQIKISVWPLIFAFGVLCSRFPRTNQCKMSVLECVEIHPNSPPEGTLHGLQPPETPLLLDNRNNDREMELSGIAEQAKGSAEIARERELSEINIRELSMILSELAETLEHVEIDKRRLSKISSQINSTIAKFLEQQAEIDSKGEQLINKSQREIPEQKADIESKREEQQIDKSKREIVEILEQQADIESKSEQEIDKSKREIAEIDKSKREIAEIDKSKLEQQAEIESKREHRITVEQVSLGRLLKSMRRELSKITVEQVKPGKELLKSLRRRTVTGKMQK